VGPVGRLGQHDVVLDRSSKHHREFREHRGADHDCNAGRYELAVLLPACGGRSGRSAALPTLAEPGHDRPDEPTADVDGAADLPAADVDRATNLAAADVGATNLAAADLLAADVVTTTHVATRHPPDDHDSRHPVPDAPAGLLTLADRHVCGLNWVARPLPDAGR
jgi:hypothetical protein